MADLTVPAGRRPRLPVRLIATPRRDVRPRHTLLALAVGLGVGLGATVAMLAAAGVPPRDVLNEFVIYTFFSSEGLALTMVAATPLIVVGLAAAAALRIGFWNIGIEGQAWMGAVCATWVAVADIGSPGARLLLMALAAMAGGALMALPPLILKRRLGVNEIITTLLLNYVAALFVQHLVFGVWKDPASSFPYSESFEPGVERLAGLGWGKVHVGLIVALALFYIVLGCFLDAQSPELRREAGASPLPRWEGERRRRTQARAFLPAPAVCRWKPFARLFPAGFSFSSSSSVVSSELTGTVKPTFSSTVSRYCLLCMCAFVAPLCFGHHDWASLFCTAYTAHMWLSAPLALHLAMTLCRSYMVGLFPNWKNLPF